MEWNGMITVIPRAKKKKFTHKFISLNNLTTVVSLLSNQLNIFFLSSSRHFIYCFVLLCRIIYVHITQICYSGTLNIQLKVWCNENQN